MSSDLLKELINSVEIESIPKDDLEILGAIIEETVCNSASVFSMLLNTNAIISVKDIKEAKNINEFSKELGDGVSAEINFEAGIDGANLLFFKNTDAIAFANTVMGSDSQETDENSQLGQLQLSAFGEIATQFSSKITTGLTTYLETKIGALSPAIKQQIKGKFEVSSTLASAPVILISYNLDLENKSSNIYQIMSIALAKDIIEKYKEAKIPNYNALKGYADLSKTDNTNGNTPVTVQPVRFSSFDNAPQITSDGKNLDLLMDIKLKLTVELGRTEMPIKKVLELAKGSVIELDKIAGEPVELYANGKLIANGEVVVIEDNFGLRITNILSPDHRLKNL